MIRRGSHKQSRKGKKKILTAFLCLAAGILFYAGGMARADGQNGEAVWDGPDVSAESYIVMDVDSGEILIGKNVEEPLAPASITKVMTAWIAAEQCLDLDAEVVVSDWAANGIEVLSSTLVPPASVGERFSVRDLLYGLMMRSGNECANALAEYAAGGEEAFAELMNEKAAAVGASKTHFVNAHGLDHEAHKTTAKDMALITRAALQNETVRTLMSAQSYTIPKTNLTDARVMQAGHQMVNGSIPLEGVYAGKTGYTVEAGWNLVTAASHGGRTLIAVTLRSDEGQNYEDTKTILSYVYDRIDGNESSPRPSLYDPRVERMSGDSFTVSWHAGNGISHVECPVWTQENGQDDLVWQEGEILGDRVYLTVENDAHGGAYGGYQLQAIGYNPQGEQTVSSVSILFSGEETAAGGITEWNGNRYYVKENGLLALGFLETEDGAYYLDPSTGVMQTGWLVQNTTYFLGEDGTVQTGWLEQDGKTYYLKPSGDMAVGLQKIDGRIYSFGDDGVRRDGWPYFSLRPGLDRTAGEAAVRLRNRR